MDDGVYCKQGRGDEGDSSDLEGWESARVWVEGGESDASGYAFVG
jgi:hypothetical protein